MSMDQKFRFISLVYILTFSIISMFTMKQALAESAMDHSHHNHHHKATTDISRQMVNYSIPNVSMINQYSDTVYLVDLMTTDKPVLLNFIYTSCTAICPVLSATFSSVQSQLGNDSEKILMVSVSIDPEYDRPTELAKYAERFNAGPQWKFLTGSLKDSISIQKAFDSDRGDKMNHAPATFIRTSSNSQWIRYDGFTKTDDIVNELRGLL